MALNVLCLEMRRYLGGLMFVRSLLVLSLPSLMSCSLFFGFLGNQEECAASACSDDGRFSFFCQQGNLFTIDCGDNGCNVETGQCNQTCGDGFLQPLLGEVCDDENNAGGDGCRADCLGVEVCGDGLVDALENCDDGNNIDNDGCDADCSAPEVVQVEAGFGHSCALLDSGAVRCWGNNEFGQLGYGNTNVIGDDEFPFVAGDVNVGGRVTQISAGGEHTCALLETGNIRCWGNNNQGQLGYGNLTNIGDDDLPFVAGDVNVGAPVAHVSAGFLHTCALLDSGEVRCWGSGGSGQLGYGNVNNIGDTEEPASIGVVNVGGVVTQISAGGSHTCALLETGNIRCWGFNLFGELGYGNTNNIGDNETPASAGDVELGGAAFQISTGGNHSCAVLDTGNIRCWGVAGAGKLGYGNTNDIGDDETPASAGDINVGGSVFQIAAGAVHTCALLEEGKVRCWGQGFEGSLGYGNTTDIGDNELPFVAGDVNLGEPIAQLSADVHSCALLTNGSVRCWGRGLFGVLGYGDEDNIGDDEPPADIGNVPLFVPVCSDGNITFSTGEDCDDENLSNGDGCSSVCQVEPGFTCLGEPSSCRPIVCGDGLVDAPERCDDGNNNENDGCSSVCQIESGVACIGEPSVCHSIVCGDGFSDAAEQCDDGNLIDDDGCSSTCQLEGFGLDCLAGQTLVQLSSTDVPKAIPDNNQTGVTSFINVADNRSVRRVIVQIGNLTHTFDGDLRILLLSPNNTEVLLFDTRGGGGDNLIDALFDDACIAANGSVAGGSAPFTGCFAPESVLSVFNNQSANGQWRLKLVDTAVADTGTLNAWTLGLCVQ
jgi:cysteine-rich repeat protein